MFLIGHRSRRIEVRYDPLIERLTDEWGDHPTIRRPRILRWLQQFKEKSGDLAAKVLDHTHYYSVSQIAALTREMVKIIRDCHPDLKKRQIFYVPIGNAGSGSYAVTRQIRNLSLARPTNVLSMYQMKEEAANLDVKLIVFVDDFSGTGNTATEFWDMCEPIIRPIGAMMAFGILLLNEPARAALERTEIELLPGKELVPSDNVLGQDCGTFDELEKRRLEKFCRKTGCSDEYVRGYGGNGLLVAFSHGCPNNSLPILWHGSRDWEALFHRRSS